MLTCLVAGGWPVTSWATDCPITHYSNSYATAKWCYLSVRDANYHLKYVAANDYITVDHSQTARPNDDAYLWAFVGTPESGFKIYNKLAGSSKILTSVKPTGGGNSTYPSMKTEAGLDTETYNTTWDAAIYELGVKIARHGETTYLSEAGGYSKLNFWTGLDQGSRFMISPENTTLSGLGIPSLSPAGKTYMLINRYTGKALGNGNVTISAVETNVGTSTSVIGTTYNNTDVQWGLTADGEKWQFVNKANSHYLNTTPNSGYLPINSTASSYYLRETGDGYYYLLTYTSVGAGDGEKIALADDGTNSHLWAASGLQAEWELREVAAASSITSGRYYRLHNVAYPNLTMSEYLSSGGVWGEDNNDNTYSQIWQITSTGANTYSLKNVMSGKYIQKTPGQSTQFHTGVASSNFFSHTSTINGFTAFAFDNNDNGYTSLHCAESRSYNVVGWTYSDTNASYWYLEEVTLTGADLTAISNLRTNNVLIDGNYYRITNKSYPGRSMSETDGHVNTVLSEDAYTQMWYVTFSSSNCDLQNAWTQNHIQGFAGRSVVFPTGGSTHYYTPSYHESGGKIYYTFGDSGSGDGSRFLHNASSQGYNVVGWGNDAEASIWMVEKLDVDPSDISALRTSVTTDYTSALSTFFDDNACTELKPAYAAMEDAALRTAMSTLPTALQDMAVRVKNNVWTDKGDYIATLGYNIYEKDFRIHDYEIYSNPNLWQTVTQVGPFARLTNPTGITAVAGDILYIFVDDDVKDSDASLQAELVTGTDRSGATTTLTQGYNAIYVDRDCELFITYLLNNTSKSCNDYPDIKIHIEGGTCNGFLDLTHDRHNNDDWAWMKVNMFADEYLHVKSNSTLLNCYRERVVDPVNVQDVKAIMDIFDFCFDNLENLAGCNQWKSTGQYKTMANNYDITSGNPHWAGDHGYAQPGIYYDGIFNANNLKNVGTGGGNIWVIMHELGHGHQSPINLSSQTESSNNSLAQCVNFLTTNSTRGQSLFTTTRSSRGDGVKGLVSRFNDGYSWIDLGGMRTQSGGYNDVWIGNKLIFQLWLYFDYMGNYPQTPGNEGFSFITALYDALRADPLVKGGTKASPRPATDDYLKLAKKAADITETDLSEFFEAWGFWKLAATKSTLNDGTPADDDPENSIWYFGDYSNNYIQTSQAQVDEIKDGMTSYSTKASNIMFLEDRGVGSTLPTHDDAATSTYGDVGYYGSFDEKVLAPYTASANTSTNTITMSGGSGAVGFKIYDNSGNLVAISNKSTFTVTPAVAAGVDNGTYTVKVAQGDGTDYVAESTGHEATYFMTTATWTSGVAMLNATNSGNYSTGWFSAVAPFHGTINSFTLNLGTGSGSGVSRTNAYLAISRDLKSTTTGFTASDFLAISTNTCGTSAYEVTMNFSPAVELQGGQTYYFYFVTESAGVYTTVNQRYYVRSAHTMSVGNVGSTTPLSSSYAVPFTSSVNLIDGSYYRMKGIWPTNLYDCYLYSNSTNENKIWKTHTETPGVTDVRYVWKGTLGSSGVIFQNMGNDHYISTISGATNGSSANYLSATTVGDAESFALGDRANFTNSTNCYAGYVTLQSTTNSGIYLNTVTNGNEYVGSHNASPNNGDPILFQQVKKVTFSTAVPVNGGSAVSTIYVAMDGSDSFTLSSDYTYTIGGIEYSYDDAATLIAAAGTSDINVTVAIVAVTDLASSSSTKKYNIRNTRGWWAVGNNAIWATSTSSWTGGLNLATSSSDTKQQFAILPFDANNDGVDDDYCLYSVNAQKFLVQATDGDNKLYLSTNPLPGRMSLTLQASTHSSNATYPAVVTLCGNSFGVHNINPNIYKYSPHLDDEGNASAIIPAGDFDPTIAQSKLAKLPLMKTVTIVDGGNTNAPFDHYGTRTNNTSPTPDVFTTGANSGLPGITITAPNMDRATAWSQKVLDIKTNDINEDETVTINVPAELGYKISSITMTVQAHSSTYPYTVTVNGNSQNVAGGSSYTFYYDNVNDYTASFTIRCNHAESVGNWLAIRNMTLYLEPIAPSLDAVASSSTSKAYAIANHSGWWAVGEDATKVTSTASATGGLNLSPSLSDTKQQFAIIPFNGEYYLYHVGEQKFVYWQKDRYTSSSSPSTWLSLSTAPVKSPLTFTTSTSTKYASTEPNIITLNSQYFGVDTSHNPHIYNNQDAANDGNAARILEAGVFDPATAESRLPIATGSLSNTKAYAITCPRGVLTFANGKLCSTACTATDYTEGTFAIITYDKNGDSTNEYYLWSIDGGGFVNASGEIDNTSPTAIQFTDRGGNAYAINFGSSSTNICVTGWGASASDPEGLNISGYSADDGCLFYICPVDDFDPEVAIGYLRGPVTVTYNVVATGGGSTLATANASAYRNETLVLPESLKRAYCSYTLYSDHACTEEITSLPSSLVSPTATVYAKYTYDGPVDFSTPGSPVWYNLKSKWDYYVGYDNSSSLTATEQRKLNSHLWVFEGNPYSFKLYNKATSNYLTNPEAGNTLANSTATNATFTAGGTAFTMYTNNAGSEGHIAIAEATTYFSMLNSSGSGTVNFFYHNGITKVDGEITSMGAAYFYPLQTTMIANLNNLANTKSYVILNERAAWKFDDDATSMSALGSGNANYYNPAAPSQQIAIIQRDADSNGTPEYYLFSVNAGKYLTANNKLTTAPTDNEQVSIAATGNSTYPWFFSFTNVSNKNINTTGDPIIKIDSWSTVDAGNRNAIIEAAAFDATDALAMFETKTVTYTLKYGGTTINTEGSVTVRLSGTAEEFLPSSLDNGFMTYTFDPETITSSTTNVDVTATWNGPFEFAATFNAATAKWYTVGMHTSYEGQKWTWAYKSSNSDKVKAEQLPVNDIANLDNTRLFTFVGDPYNGFDIYNRAAGAKKLYRGGESDEISMTNDGEKFIVAKSHTNPDTQTYFCLKPDGATNYLNMNYNGGKVITGWDDNDNGSTCWVNNPGDYYLNYIDELALDAPLGAVGTKEYFTTVANPTTAKDNVRGWRSTVAANLNSGELSSLNSLLEPIYNSATISLGAGYWRIVSAYPGYVTQQSKMPAIYYDHDANKLKWHINALTDVSYSVNTILKLTASSTDYTIQTPNTGKYLNAANGSLNEGSGATFTFTSLGSAQYNISTSDNKLHTNGHSSGAGTSGTLVAWNGGLNTCSAWYIIRADEVSLTLNDATDINGRTNAYGTTKLPFDVTLPSGVNAYSLTNNQSTRDEKIVITPTKLGQEIAAGTPVMMMGAEGSGTITATIGATSPAGEPDGSIMAGTYVPLTSDHASEATTYLTLGRNSGIVGFYVLIDGRTIAANRAYIPYTTLAGGAGVKGFAIAWDFDEDGIEELTEDVKGQMSDVVYDLQGRRVMNPKKGIYIVNGKKTVVK